MRAIRSAESAAYGASNPVHADMSHHKLPPYLAGSHQNLQNSDPSLQLQKTHVRGRKRGPMLPRECRQSRVGRPRALNLYPQHLLEQKPSMMPCPIHHHYVRVIAQFARTPAPVAVHQSQGWLWSARRLQPISKARSKICASRRINNRPRLPRSQAMWKHHNPRPETESLLPSCLKINKIYIDS